ncbi:MAG TPA: 30S ribosomal protein S6 [Tissierellaceae bacterium]
MRNYEAVLIFYPNTEEEKRTQILERFKGIVEEEGSVTKVDEWGLRKLAYTIDDLNEGYYVLVNFETNPEMVLELERVVKISDSIMRHIIIREDE